MVAVRRTVWISNERANRDLAHGPRDYENVDMVMDRGTFVFAEDGVDFFLTVEEAARSVEAIDVTNGVYNAIFTLTGEQLEPEIIDEVNVKFRFTGSTDLDALRDLLHQEQDRHRTFLSDPDVPTAVANEFLLREWTKRWPK